jgi:hypothetical protein
MIDAQIGGDSKQPCAEAGTPVELAQPLIGAQEHLLRDIFRILRVADHTAHIVIDAVGIEAHNLVESGVILRLCPRDQGRLHMRGRIQLHVPPVPFCLLARWDKPRA